MYDRSTREWAMDLLATGISVNAASEQLGISRAALRKGAFSLRITCDNRYPGLQQEARCSIEAVRPEAGRR